VRLGGKPLPGPGHFFPPTVLTDVPDGSRLLAEEIFGPVAAIRTFAYDAEAIAEANATEFGLVAFLYTQDLSRAMRTAETLQTGMVGINQGIVSNPAAPFGGVKQSGIGREGGREGIDEYLETKYVAFPA
jgi:succinate-semialdehyde dehydrogenase/glutarate-semialdehyde dehydrogenase